MASQIPYERDLEKEDRVSSFADDGAVPGETFVQGNSTYAKIQRLAAKFHVEQRGIERVPEDERFDNSLLNVGTMVSLLQMFERITIDKIDSGSPPTWWCRLSPLVSWLRSYSISDS